MSFLIQATVHKLFTAPGGKDKKTGQEYPESHKVQLISSVTLKNGDTRDELFTLSLPGGQKQAQELQSAIGHEVTLPVGIIVSGGKITPFLTAE